MPYVTAALADSAGRVVATSDWMRAVPDLIRPWVPSDFSCLGTDGFGISETRPAARRHCAVDAESITVAVLAALARRGEMDHEQVREAATRYRLGSPNAVNSTSSTFQAQKCR